jgi:diguanylate cyclase (GGDEF)-like protein/PAS domain S-box-containing protein
MTEPNDFFQDLLDNLADGVYFTDLQGRITYWNKGAERLSGFSKTEVLGRSCSDNLLMHVDSEGRTLCGSGCPLRATALDGRPHEAEAFLHHKDGSRIPILVRSSPLKDGSGVISGAVEIFSDNTAQIRMAERLAQMEQLALLDQLTGLPNRRYLESHISSSLGELRRNGWIFGLFFMDIDDFKPINDRFGHEVGDRVLRMVAGTLDHNTRSFDVVGRWGGDEFIAVIHNADEKGLNEIGERFRMLVERSVLTEINSLRVTLSIGGAQADAVDSVESALNRADVNLYRAKQSGKNRVCIEPQLVPG